MKYLVAVFITVLAVACAPRLDAINWYLRLESTEECDGYGLYGGEYKILCDVEDAIWNGDSLVVKSAGVCYFIHAAEYKDGQPLREIDCADFQDFMTIAKTYWVNGEGPPEEESLSGY